MSVDEFLAWAEVRPGRIELVDAATPFEPDALIYSGPPMDLGAIRVPEPGIVVEGPSPSTRAAVPGRKLARYFGLARTVH